MKQPKIPLCIKLLEPLYRKLKTESHKQGIPMTGLVREAIREYLLSKQEPGERTERIILKGGRPPQVATPKKIHGRDGIVSTQLVTRISPWSRNRVVELVKEGVYQTMGEGVDELIKVALSADTGVQFKVTIPDSQKELGQYYPVLARDMAPGVWSSLREVERRLCTLVAFFSTLNDVEMGRWANTTPGAVKQFKISNLGLESVRIGEQRALLSERLRFWRDLMNIAQDSEHPRNKDAIQLLGNRLFAPAEKKQLLLAMSQDPDGARPIVTNPHDVDMEFMEYAASIQMIPERFVKLYAGIMGEPVGDVVQRLVRKYHANESTEGDVVLEEMLEGPTDSERGGPEAEGPGEDS